ncbi:MAG: nuclear transport factor 2 family protein [Verrucomicrobia bacterium]|nr:nuclear transport factor 2 family protein [Verrucomicrobiota bacterium]
MILKIVCNSVLGILTASALCLLLANRATADDTEAAIDTPTKHEIVQKLKAYENALDTSNTEAVMAVYASEPVFIPEYAKALIGRDAVRRAYDHGFQSMKLNIKFAIHEIVDMGGDLAYVRTTSAGQQEMLATHKMLPEANNELFIFRREDGQWKIYRYLFASSNRPPA